MCYYLQNSDFSSLGTFWGAATQIFEEELRRPVVLDKRSMEWLFNHIDGLKVLQVTCISEKSDLNDYLCDLLAYEPALKGLWDMFLYDDWKVIAALRIIISGYSLGTSVPTKYFVSFHRVLAAIERGRKLAMSDMKRWQL